MIYCKGNIWDFQKLEFNIVIPTNGVIDKHGNAVMGAGLALQAKQKYSKLPSYLGKCIKINPTKRIFTTFGYGIITFQTKYHWRNRASTSLIEEACRELKDYVNSQKTDENIIRIAIPKVGCGLGGLKWECVKPILETYLDDNFLLVEENIKC